MAIVAVAVGGCRSTALEDALGRRVATENDWFCSANEDGVWECAQEPSLDAAPETRVGTSAARQAAETTQEPNEPAQQPVAASEPADAPNIDRQSVPTETAQEPNEPAPRPVAASEPADARNIDPQSVQAETAQEPNEPAQQPVTASKPADPGDLDRQTVFDWPPDHFALQLIALDTAAALDRFAARVDTPSLLHVPIESRDRRFHVLLLGPYPTRREAEAAAAELAARNPFLEPWVRRIGPLQDAAGRTQPSHSD